MPQEPTPRPNMVFFYGSAALVLVLWLPIAIGFELGPLVAAVVAGVVWGAIVIPWAVRRRRRLTRRD